MSARWTLNRHNARQICVLSLAGGSHLRHLEIMTTSLTVQLNGASHQVPSGSSLSDLVNQLTQDPRGVAIERNGEIVPKSLHRQTIIIEGDQIEFVQFVGGG